MANIKVSELVQVASVENTDLIEISRKIPGGWESHSMTIKTLNTSVSGPRVVIVSKSGTGDALTIEGGLALAASLSPTQVNPVVVQVMTGYYTENNPLVVPDYVTIEGIGGSQAVAVAPVTNNIHIFEMGAYTSLSGMTIQHAHSSGGIGILVNNSYVTLSYLVIYFCETGVKVINASNYVNCIDVTVYALNPYILQDAFLCQNQSKITINQSSAYSPNGSASAFNGFRCTGTGSEMYLFSLSVNGMSNACYADDGGKIVVTGSIFQNGNNGLYIGSNGTNSKIISVGTDMVNNSGLDMWISNGVSGVINFNGKYDAWKRFIGTGGQVYSVAQDGSINGSRSTGRLISEGPLEIGYPGYYLTGQDLNLNVGEGASTRYNNYGEEIVEFWKYDASAPSGSKFTRYANNAGIQLTSQDDAIIVGQVYPYANIRYNVVTAANVGSANIVAEYWNGINWVDTSFATWRRSDYLPRLNQPFQNVEIQFLEIAEGTTSLITPAYDLTDDIPAWDYGDYLYPVRYRNNGAALVSGMVFNAGMTKPDSWTVGVSKRQILFGDYRKKEGERVIVLNSAMDPDPNNPPLQFIVNVSSHILFENDHGLFTYNNVCATSLPIQLPWWVDTGTPVNFEVYFVPTNSNVGSVSFNLYWAELDVGNILDGTGQEGSAVLTTNTLGTAYMVQSVEEEIDIRDKTPGKVYRVQIERNSPSTEDTYNGDVGLLRAEIYFTRKIVS